MLEDTNALSLAKNLLSTGCDVRFYDDLTQHPAVQKVIGNSVTIPSTQNIKMVTQAVQSALPFTLTDANNCFMSLFGTPLKWDPLETACRLCGAMVSITRHSHLATHVTKHCQIKKFQCTECSFASTGRVKVVTHMRQQHFIINLNPISKSHQEIQQEINLLLEQCFPDYNQKLDVLRATINPGVQQDSSRPTYSSYTCAECHIRLTSMDGKELCSDGELISHLRIQHTLQCMPWGCKECNWKSAYEWKVRRHICVRHTERASQITVFKDKTPDWKLFLHKYFLNLPDSISQVSKEEKMDEEIDMNRLFWNHVVKSQEIGKRKIATTPGRKRERRI